MIPILLMLAHPPGYPHPGPSQGAQVRASDDDRDITVDMLCAAVGHGRLTLAELEQRVGAALTARTRTELAALIADLPGRRCTAARPGAPTPSRWSLIQSLMDAWASPASVAVLEYRVPTG